MQHKLSVYVVPFVPLVVLTATRTSREDVIHVKMGIVVTAINSIMLDFGFRRRTRQPLLPPCLPSLNFPLIYRSVQTPRRFVYYMIHVHSLNSVITFP